MNAQLAALRDVVAGVDAELWLFGGWAVDFHAGRVTREHSDVDFAVWHSDVPRIAVQLEAQGWSHAPEPDEDGGTGYERDGVRVEMTFLERDDDGVYTPVAGRRARWSAEALGDDVRMLEGARARVVSLASLTRSKSQPRDDPEEAARDRADYETLRRL